MRLLDYLANDPSCEAEGLPHPDTGRRGPRQFVIDTAILAEWSRTNAAELGDGQATFDRFIREVDRANGPGEWRINLSLATSKAQQTANDQVLLGRFGMNEAVCVRDGEKIEPYEIQARRLKRRLHSLVSMGLQARGHYWAAFKSYGEAEKYEASRGFTDEFYFRHISLTEKGLQGRRVARVRLQTIPDRVAMLGNGAVPVSTTIDAKAAVAFEQEVKSRKDEFTQTYAALTDWFIRTSIGDTKLDSLMQVHTRLLAGFDELTFVSKNRYKFYESTRAGGSRLNSVEREEHIQFALAPVGKDDWAVHHYAGWGVNPGEHGTRLSDLGVGGFVNTHVLNPFRVGGPDQV